MYVTALVSCMLHLNSHLVPGIHENNSLIANCIINFVCFLEKKCFLVAEWKLIIVNLSFLAEPVYKTIQKHDL